jgi:nickel/cobalt transporter (NicO) family protein
MLQFMVEVQRTIHASLSSDVAAFANNRDWLALLAILPVGILFGAVHALTPGHSKAVLAA